MLVNGGFQTQHAFHLYLIPGAIVALAVFLGLGYPWIRRQRERLPFGFVCFVGFLACVAATVGIQAAANLPDARPALKEAALYAIFAALLLEIPLLALACVPLRAWAAMLRATSPLWIYAGVTGVAAAEVLVCPSRYLWSVSDAVPGGAMQAATLSTVQSALRPWLPGLTANPAASTIGTPGFTVIIGRGCSGMEGLGLVLAFSLAWLWYLRKEIRFARAALFIPLALILIWCANILRLCLLIFIGAAGHPEVAMVGFHSQFGWIAFTVVALAFCLVIQRLPWVRRDAPAAAETRGGESPAVFAYLVPFLAILGASFVSKAASGYFEWLYPLRFVAAAVAIAYFWPRLKKLDWRFGWAGPVTGAAVFLVWIAPTLYAHQFAATRLGASLAALPPVGRWTWVAFRVAAAAVTVPVAEELAFRGYLARRFMSREFDGVAFTSLSALSILLSSAVFGLMHGRQWLVGIVAGVAYALALRWRGRIGDAVVAHAATNLLLAVWVLALGDWAQW